MLGVAWCFFGFFYVAAIGRRDNCIIADELDAPHKFLFYPLRPATSGLFTSRVVNNSLAKLGGVHIRTNLQPPPPRCHSSGYYGF